MRAFICKDPELNGVAIAPLWRRTLAWLIDSFLIFAVQLVLGLLSVAVVSFQEFQHTGNWTLDYNLNERQPSLAFVLSLVLIPYLLYHSLLLHRWSGYTPGKNFMLVRVISKKSPRVAFGQALLRTFLMPISAIPLLLGYLGLIRSHKNSSLHDMIAGTIVLQEEVEHRVMRGEVATSPVAVHH